MKKIKISICIISYNQQKFIAECIESCLAQAHDNYEIVITDDGSIDGTIDIIMGYKEKYPQKIKTVLMNKNSGISANCNRGWRACSGDWIKTIAGDDKLKIDCLKVFNNQVISDDGEYDAYFSKMEIFDDDGVGAEIPLNHFFFSLPADEKIKYLIYINPLMAPTSFIKRSSLEGVGYANEFYPMLEDYPLWFSLIESGKKIKSINYSTVLYRVGVGISNSKGSICNISYLQSLHDFRVQKIWPYLGFWAPLKKLDDFTFYYQKKIGYYLFKNKKSFLYLLMVAVMAPFRLFKLLLLTNIFLVLLIKTTKLNLKPPADSRTNRNTF